MDNPNAEQLASIIIATGLAQNLAALRALVSTGIQAGHMALQAKSLAIQVGAKDNEVDLLVARLNQSSQINASMAQQLLQEMRHANAEQQRWDREMKFAKETITLLDQVNALYPLSYFTR